VNGIVVVVVAAISPAGIGGESFLLVSRAGTGMMRAPMKSSGVPERREQMLDHGMPRINRYRLPTRLDRCRNEA